MKKLFTLLVLTAICFSAWRCNDKEYSDPTLDVDALYLYPGMSYSVAVSGGSGEYAVELRSGESTADFAGVFIESSYGGPKNVLVVETCEGEEGVATIVVTDTRSGKTTECFLLVNSGNFVSGYTFDEQKHFVHTTLRAEEIESDLKSKRFPVGSSLFLNPHPNHDSYGAGHWVVVETNELNVIVDTLASGTFVSMPLSPKDIPTAYEVLPIEQDIHSAVRYVFEQEDGQHVYDQFYVSSPGTSATLDIHIYEDRTSYYQAKYPNADVKAVVNRYIDRYGH